MDRAKANSLEDSMWQITTFRIDVVSWLRSEEPGIAFWPRKAPLPQHRLPGESSKTAGSGTSPDDPGIPPLDGDGSDHGGGEGGDGGDIPWEDEMKLLLEELQLDIPRTRSAGGGGGSPPVPEPEPDPTTVEPPPPVHPDVVEPPPPVQPQPRPKRKGRGDGVYHPPRYPHLEVFDDSGRNVGYLLVSEHTQQIDAHCNLHGPSCRTGATYIGWDPANGPWTELRRNRGRPLAYLIAWLRWGSRFADGPEGRDAHFAARKGSDVNFPVADGSGRLRLQCREWAVATPAMLPAIEAERPPRVGEPLEPLGRVA